MNRIVFAFAVPAALTLASCGVAEDDAEGVIAAEEQEAERTDDPAIDAEAEALERQAEALEEQVEAEEQRAEANAEAM
ncbi:DUF5320 domain-containing protein [Sphingomicrobium sp. XHP0239]|uniref:DUF5320 domain-containing protein n=1 Tax=Sphingomicrobium maritimum TaxID=3133972 RepID=UPI0031CC6499